MCAALFEAILAVRAILRSIKKTKTVFCVYMCVVCSSCQEFSFLAWSGNQIFIFNSIVITVSKEMDDSAEAEVFNRSQDNSGMPVFKKPVIVGKRPGISKLPVPAEEKKLEDSPSSTISKQAAIEPANSKDMLVKADKKIESSNKVAGGPTVDVVNYKEPKWSGLCGDTTFSLEIIKNGIIVQNEDLTLRPYFVIGRLPACNIVLEHPSVSRYFPYFLISWI